MNEIPHGPNLPQRRRPAHHTPIERHNCSTIIFLTVCAKERRPILANAKMHGLIRAAWIASNHWLIGRYTIMPDHLHLFCTPDSLVATSLKGWMRFWKTEVSKVAGFPEGTLWQKDFWDVQLRHGDSYAAKWEYVRNNPVRARLVARPEDWPYQGEINILRWHD